MEKQKETAKQEDLYKLADSIPVFKSDEELVKASHSNPLLCNENYIVFYNGLINAMITDKSFISLLVDDMIIHRGSGVFDSFGVVNFRPYLIDKHLARFFNSIKKNGLEPPGDLKEVQSILLSLVAYAGHSDVAVRCWCTPGPAPIGSPASSVCSGSHRDVGFAPIRLVCAGVEVRIGQAFPRHEGHVFLSDFYPR